MFSYRLNVMVDSASGIVLDARASPARRAEEPIAAYRMIDRVRARHGARPRMLPADRGHGSGHFLARLEGQGIEAHVPLMVSRDGTGRRPPEAAFTYDPASDTYTCPHGRTLHRAGSKLGQFRGGSRTGDVPYHPSRRECGACPIQPDRAPSGLRTVHRGVHEPARERAKAREGTDAFRLRQAQAAGRARLHPPSGHHDDLHRVRLRGLRGLRGADGQVPPGHRRLRPQADGPPDAAGRRRRGVRWPPGPTARRREADDGRNAAPPRTPRARRPGSADSFDRPSTHPRGSASCGRIVHRQCAMPVRGPEASGSGPRLGITLSAAFA